MIGLVVLAWCTMVTVGCRRETAPQTPAQPSASERATSDKSSSSSEAREPASHTPPEAIAKHTATRHGGLSNDGSYQVRYTPKPDPIPLNEMFELTVWVFAASDRGAILREVQLAADAAMPDHDHGMNTKPKVKANADGSFTVGGMLFHMPGHWELYLDVTRAGITERAQFDVQLE